MIPLNLLQGRTADYINSGSWATKAIKEAKYFGTVNVIASSEDKNFNYIPRDFIPSSDSVYLHLTSNETIGGIQWPTFPETGNTPLIADMSSDIFSRKIQVSDFGLIYAGAQKNMGPAGVTLVIIRDDLVESSADNLTSMLSYKTHVEKKSLYNTPPCFAIYIIKLVLDWLEIQGGVSAIEETNAKKANLLYTTIDDSSLYRGTAAPEDRSKMNVTFRLTSEELEAKFIQEANEKGFIGLKGHRSVGGCRASIYNAMPLDGVEKLAEFMRTFEKEN
jgi:phosphoserine aminotransferase